MKFYLFPVCLVLLAGIKAGAQQDHAGQRCAEAKRRAHSQLQARPTIGDPLEENYDVKYIQLDLSLDNNSTALKGSATTKAVTTTAMSEYAFELISDYTIDSLKINGVIRPVTLSGYVRKASLPAALPAGTLFTAQVYYRGSVSSGGGFFDGGIRTETSPSWNANVTYTLSEPYAAKDWWPCKQSLQDKIDSADIWITVPSALKAGSNGVLKAVTPVSGGKSRYEWKSRNPIDYYLVSLAVAPYTDYSYYTHFTGSTDSVLVQNYVYNNPLTLPQFKAVIDSTGPMINFFSSLYGRYPFWKEKYGHCMAPLGGGMEHQTMTTLGFFEPSLVAHELGHQWFGDHVTCGSWGDIWLNEGFAAYSEYLYQRYSEGLPAAASTMASLHNRVMAETDGSVYCTDTTDENRIFDSRLTYDKGSAVVHMLRFIAGDDTRFFDLLRNYQVQFANSTANTEQFKTFAATAYGRNLDTFFNQWIYGEGYPVYSAAWNQVGDQVIVRLSQTTSMPSSINLFVMPLEISMTTATGEDTVVTVYNNMATQTFSFNWARTATGLDIDPNNWVLNRVGNITKDNTLSVTAPQLFSGTVYPNPARQQWTLTGLTAGCTLRLCDMSGRTLAEVPSAGKQTVDIDARGLATGMYLLRIADKAGHTQYLKLLKAE
ncbi:M1 family aminopeptidase [Taibaiella chishuiensis]|uniref:Aminopeptidase N n=1 Tax=Taibaiella chishuiensis TaxID=1434707 RepID=A0A2P8D5K9_9BACT|nr:M1 family aminopeptidase [Taibaiella chishuiensis]PSK92482.1 putative secreted protein (Por secretion system target) [Taibaiella chishuiensis]